MGQDSHGPGEIHPSPSFSQPWENPSPWPGLPSPTARDELAKVSRRRPLASLSLDRDNKHSPKNFAPLGSSLLPALPETPRSAPRRGRSQDGAHSNIYPAFSSLRALGRFTSWLPSEVRGGLESPQLKANKLGGSPRLWCLHRTQDPGPSRRGRKLNRDLKVWLRPLAPADLNLLRMTEQAVPE